MKQLLAALALAYMLMAGAVVVLVDLAQPCPTEDSRSCTWYAHAQGSNPGGRSFTDVGGVVVIRWGGE